MSLSRKLATLIVTERTTLSDVVTLLTKYKMLSLLPSIKQAVIQASSQVGAQEVIKIESPFPLSDDAITHVKRIVGNNTVDHEVTINPKILAGFKARFKGILYDGSAERIIKQLTGSV
jgi:F0F1-type ATP synthase delta subunit